MSSMETLQRLREKTGLGIMDLKKSLEDAGGDESRALELLKAKGISVAEKRAERATGQGAVVSYVHGGRIGSLVALQCETDFVARTDDFKELAKDIAMQIASMDPQDIDQLLEQPFVKDPSKTVQSLITEMIAKTGENIRIGRFSRVELGL